MSEEQQELKPCPFECGAYDNLLQYQRQLDEEGVEVGVSREALYYLLDWAQRQRASSLSSPQGEEVDVKDVIHSAIKEYTGDSIEAYGCAVYVTKALSPFLRSTQAADRGGQ